MPDEFTQRRVFGIFLCTDNTCYHAGNTKLFHDEGPTVYLYGAEAPGGDWAVRRVWIFWLFALLHVSEGKSTSINGWHLLLPRIEIKKRGGEFSITFRRIDLYGSIRSTRLERFKAWYHGRRLSQG